MKSAMSAGREIGILLLLQLAAGLVAPFILLVPLATVKPNYLAVAAENSFQARLAVFIAFAGAALTVTLGVKAFPVFRRYSQSTALWFLVICVVSAVLDAVHNASVISVVSFSHHYLNNSDPADPTFSQAAGAAFAMLRRSAHVVQLVGIGSWVFVFYSSLWRFRLIPRLLATFGIVAIALQFTGVTLMMLMGNSVMSQLAMPMLPVQIATALWLIVKGFNEGPAENRLAETNPTLTDYVET